MEVAENILQHLKVPVSGECVTKEKLILDIQAQEQALECFKAEDKHRVISPLTVCASELSEFLGAGGIGMISFLTTIYGRSFYEYRTKNKGTTAIKGPFLNLVACTTPDWITTYLRTDVISGGFSRRAIFVYETARGQRVTIPTVTPLMQAAWDRVVAYGRTVSKVAGRFTWDPEALVFYDRWYQTMVIPTDPNLVGYYETKHIQLLKISMLVALSEGFELVLRKSHLEAGLAILGLAEYNLARVFQGIGRNELNAVATRVLDYIANAPKIKVKKLDGSIVDVPAIPEKRLKVMMFRDLSSVTEADYVLNHLKETDKIGVSTETVGGETRVMIYYKTE
jgi:hypothetical protein